MLASMGWATKNMLFLANQVFQGRFYLKKGKTGTFGYQLVIPCYGLSWGGGDVGSRSKIFNKLRVEKQRNWNFSGTFVLELLKI